MKMNQVKSLLVNAATNSNDFESKAILEGLQAAEKNKEVVIITHKDTNCQYIVCGHVPELNNRYDIVDINSGEVKTYAESTIKRKFRKSVEQLEVEEVIDQPAEPAAVDPALQPEMPAEDKSTKAFLIKEANELTYDIVKFFLDRGFHFKCLKGYVKVYYGKRTAMEIYYNRKTGGVRLAVNGEGDKYFQYRFPENRVREQVGWSLSCVCYLEEDCDRQALIGFLDSIRILYMSRVQKF